MKKNRFIVGIRKPEVVAVVTFVVWCVISYFAFRPNFTAVAVAIFTLFTAETAVVSVSLVVKRLNNLMDRISKLERSFAGFEVGEKNKIS